MDASAQGTSVDNSTASVEDNSHGSVVVGNTEDGGNKFSWSNNRVKKLIDMHTKYEDLFRKPGIKKMSVWKTIADEMNKSEGIGGSCIGCSSIQCEQKWKNITKKFRDCVDYNSKSGNEKKECPFFHELLGR
ncbi:MAG: SANT/Myb-like DNA-binding domain-containing protein [Candidatus Thiodiazotropha sp.]